MFVVPKAEGAKKENRFDFKIGTKSYSVPFIQYLGGLASAYAEDNMAIKSEISLMRELMIIECPDAEDAIRALSVDQCKALSDAWNEASTGSAGESSASDNSD